MNITWQLQSKGPERDCMHLNNNQQREEGGKTDRKTEACNAVKAKCH